MQLQAVIIPPDGVIEDALAAARTISLTPPPMPEPASQGVLARLRRRQAPPPPEPEALTVVQSQASFIRLGSFGNVTIDDAQTLTRALTEEARSWRPPALRVTGLRFEPHEHGRLTVTALLGGDTDGLFSLFHHVVNAGRQHNFFLDRRAYRTELELAYAEPPGGDASVWERLDTGDAESHQGRMWQSTALTMVRTSLKGGHRTYVEVEVMPLAEPDVGFQGQLA